MANTKPKGGLTAWFGKGKKGDWVDIGAPKKKGRFQPCGRKSAKKSKRAYPKCVPRSKARSMTAAQRRSAVARKRRAGNPGGKPTNVRTMVKRKKRRGSFCARSAGQMKKFPKAAKNPNSRLRQARRRWKC